MEVEREVITSNDMIKLMNNDDQEIIEEEDIHLEPRKKKNLIVSKEEEEEIESTTTDEEDLPIDHRLIDKSQEKEEEKEEVLHLEAKDDEEKNRRIRTTTTTTTIREEESPHGNSSFAETTSHQSSKSSSSVYFDNNNGTESGDGTGWTKFSAVSSSTSEITTRKEGSETTVNTSDNQKSVTFHRSLNGGENSGLRLIHSGKHYENGTTSFEPVENDTQVAIKEEHITEVAEWDVEKVLKEQETHDLFCPNCHSCITKRVILRKRKRKTQNIENDTKREKIEAVVQPGVVDGPSELDSSVSTLENDGQESETGPDVFRCLSCFSFFIPTVSGFKLFRMFRSKGGDENVQSPQEVPPLIGTGLSAVATQENFLSQTFLPGNTTVTIRSPAGDDNTQDFLFNRLHTKGGKHNNEDGGDKSVTLSSKTTTTTIGEPGEDTNMKLQFHNQNITVSSTLHSPPNAVSYLGSDLTAKPLCGEKVESNGYVGEEGSDSSVTPSNTTTIIIGEPGEDPNVKLQFHNQNIAVSSKSHYPSNAVSYLGSGLTAKPLHGEKVESNGYVGEDAKTAENNMTENGIVLHSNMPLSSLSDDKVSSAKNDSTREFSKDYTAVQIQSELEALLPQHERIDYIKDLQGSSNTSGPGKDLTVNVHTESGGSGASSSVLINIHSSAPEIVPNVESELVSGERVDVTGRTREWDILKSIVHGGLIESITSLGVVSSAAGSDATTLNIIALGLANLVTGLFIIVHGLKELKHEEYGGSTNERENADRYHYELGQRRNFVRHAFVVVLSYLIFGLLPPLIYGFSFHRSGNREYKMLTVALSSLFCVFLLAIGKAHVGRPSKSYTITVMYYMSMGVMASGLSYVVGVLIQRLLHHLGWFDTNETARVSLFLETASANQPNWASY